MIVTKWNKRVVIRRFKSYAYDEVMQRDKVNLDIFWLKYERLEYLWDLAPQQGDCSIDCWEFTGGIDVFSAIYEELGEEFE